MNADRITNSLGLMSLMTEEVGQKAAFWPTELGRKIVDFLHGHAAPRAVGILPGRRWQIA
jgi:hypothetical protein